MHTNRAADLLESRGDGWPFAAIGPPLFSRRVSPFGSSTFVSALWLTCMSWRGRRAISRRGRHAVPRWHHRLVPRLEKPVMLPPSPGSLGVKPPRPEARPFRSVDEALVPGIAAFANHVRAGSLQPVETTRLKHAHHVHRRYVPGAWCSLSGARPSAAYRIYLAAATRGPGCSRRRSVSG